MILRIVSPHFVAGITPGVAAAPIIRLMLHWSVEKIEAYCKRRGWTVERIM